MSFAPAPGLELVGRYRLVGRLGGGPLGSVWKATEIDTERKVALKLLRGEGLGTSAVERVRIAAVSIDRIEHPGALPIDDVFGIGEGDECLPIAVVPYVSGQAFDRWLRTEPRLLRDCVGLIREAVDVLAAAHTATDSMGRPSPVPHLGLKPAEILVGRDRYRGPGAIKKMRVRILDFGLVRHLTEEDVTGTVTMVASPRYASPELLIAPDIAGPRSDVWALGVMLFVVASGRYPFGEVTDTPFMTQRRIVDAPSPRLADVAPDLPAELCALVDRCLAKDPQARFADAAELARALDELPRLPDAFPGHPFPVPYTAVPRAGEAYVEGSTPSIAPPSTAPPSLPPPSPMRGRLALVASLALVGIAGAGAGGYFLRTRHETIDAGAVAAAAPVDAGSVAPSDEPREEPVAPAPTGLVAELVADNAFVRFRVPDEPMRLGCAEEPPTARVMVESVSDAVPFRQVGIDGGLLAGLRMHGVCAPGQRRDESGRCWVVGCLTGMTGPDAEGHCHGLREVEQPIQTCFRDGAGVRSIPAEPVVELQQHEVSWAELGRYLVATSQRAFVAVDPETSQSVATVWDGSISEANRELPAHGIPRQLARRYCAAIEARLPTEAELETAARGRTFGPSPWGRAQLAFGTQLPSLAPAGTRPRPVRDEASLDRTVADEPLYDLVSNVREWASDAYRPDGTTLGVATDPADGGLDGAVTVPVVVASGTLGVVRGLPLELPATWPRASRSRALHTFLPVPAAFRTPLCAVIDGRIDEPDRCVASRSDHLAALRDVGFRCARTAP